MVPASRWWRDVGSALSPNYLVSKVLSFANQTALFTATEARVTVTNLELCTGDNV